MEIRQTHNNDNLMTLSLIGDFDSFTSKSIQVVIDEIVQKKQHTDILLDLAHVDFIDSSGIGAIVYLYKKLCLVERLLYIEEAHGQVLKMLKLLRIDTAIAVNQRKTYHHIQAEPIPA